MVKLCKGCNTEKDISCFYKKGKHTTTYCIDCSKGKAKEYAKARVKDGKCRNCSLPRMKTTRYCLNHLVKRICDFHHINVSLVPQLIEKLYKQKFQCYYTGLLLVPGMNLSLDHVIAKKYGIDNSIDNLVWCDLAINKMKQGTEVGIFVERNKAILDEFRFIASFDTDYQKQLKLNFILGTTIDIALNIAYENVSFQK